VARHFLDLAGAATLETESYLLAQRAVADAVDANAMAVLHGDAGLGKTFAVEDARRPAAAGAVGVVSLAADAASDRRDAADPPDTTIGEDANADGRALLLRLSAWHLWLEHDEPGT